LRQVEHPVRLAFLLWYRASFFNEIHSSDQAAAISMSSIDYFVDAIRKFADFGGRANRREFWMFSLIYFVLSLLLELIDYWLGLNMGFVFGIVMTVPCLSVTSRRLHDTGRSGWWQLILILPVFPVAGSFALGVFFGGSLLPFYACMAAWCIACMVLLVFLAQPSQADNRYGPLPGALAQSQ
jgi:uncharacterized membrane protein YhaH (DUF805 family)